MSGIRLPLRFLLTLAAALLCSCAHEPETLPNGQPRMSGTDAEASYAQGLADYQEGRFDIALGKLDAAIASDRLKSEEANNARKHMAFIYCVTNRELDCRTQFRLLLKGAPEFDLSPGEIGHPLWGPVWRSIKGEQNEQRAISYAESSAASPAQHKMAAGIREYQADHFKEAVETLDAAVKAGLPQKSDEILARKYAAFSYCLESRHSQCRAEFRAIFTLDGDFELLPSEANHPGWAGIYRKEQAAARHGAQK